MNIPDYLSDKFNIKLNKQQAESIFASEKEILLLAVPGSGKTTVLVSKIAHLILNEGVDAKKILTITFSKESAKDMKQRFTKLFGDVVSADVHFSTIHSFCYSILQYYSKRYNRNFPTLLSSTGTVSQSVILRQINDKVNEDFLSDDMLEALVNDIGLVKNLMLTESEIENYQSMIENFPEILEEYDNFKKQNSYMDFDDLLLYALDIIKKVPAVCNYFNDKYDYINVDEAQDTSKVQHKIVQIFSKSMKLFMVGDEDQCIYSFRGAYPEGLTQFQKIYPNAKILKVEENYRSNSDIVKHANDFIKVNKQRYDKNMFCGNDATGSVEVVKLEDYSEQYEDIVKKLKQIKQDETVAVLYRNNESAVSLIHILQKYGMKYYIKEHNLKFFNSFIVKDIVAYMNLAMNPKNEKAFEQIYYKHNCSKLVNIFVKMNASRYDDVFDCAFKSGQMTSYAKDKLKILESKLPRILRLSPYNAIGYIETTLGYRDYLDSKTSDGLNSINAGLKIDILKNIAKHYSTLEAFLRALMMLEHTIKQNANDLSSNVTLSTIHSSKGLEFDHVILLNFIEGIIPTASSIECADYDDMDDLESEARLFYVAVTRAKRKLTIYSSNYCNNEYIIRSRFVTRFLNEKTPKVAMKQMDNSKGHELVGKKIRHKFFGIGQVCSCNKDELTVHFLKHGVKILSYRISMGTGLIGVLQE